MSVSFCFLHAVGFSAFIICSNVCACVAILVVCVLYVREINKKCYYYRILSIFYQEESTFY